LFSIKTKIPRAFSSLENNVINSIVVKDGFKDDKN